ncbi:winged helix DNA-binding domain-containing protein [Nocardia sp. CDC159]|uniref:Winged helix DNA-binding domain-containing protein n=1 Tax=Nocardia pulmonis TaxID=2951408 RepID=A0A9X2E7P0_9NOCA|nr:MULTISPECIES: winged helix DNA-binding domain-containing protein [Nocardia]MCM6775279.1 winged helix DNA-binding domain-containing protein [Nocardia pulmonis]MCM6787987.1 winged helix DNA-binding domain-containing protein [Nocardia sp. CDC159]
MTGNRVQEVGVRVTWDQVFAWRLRQQFVAPRGEGDAVTVAERLCGVQAQVSSAAETAVALRHSSAGPGAVAAALADGRLIKTWAMRGTLHALTPEFAAAALSLLAAARTWEKPSWQKNFGASPAEVAALGEAIGEVLDGRVLTRAELVEALLREPRFHRMGEELRSGWGALLKPLAWQGILCHGPVRGANITFAAPARLLPGWPGLADPETAGPRVVSAYLRAFGPATPEAFGAWLMRGAHRKSLLRQWFSDLGGDLIEVDVDGRAAYLHAADADALAATAPTGSVRLLGPFDQYILAPGTNDTALLPAAHRAKVSRTAGWISPLVLTGGRITGTWELADGVLTVAMFDGGAVDEDALRAEAAHVARATGRSVLEVVVQ